MANPTPLGFRESMYVFAAEHCYSPSRLKVYIPEVFTDKTISDREYRLYRTADIFVNAQKPTVSQSVVSKNYIELPVMDGALNSRTVHVGDRLVALFINSNPINGIILGNG
jgi:hypothetical protein